jgi:RNA polymerase sigma factor (sigma-70 family)
VYKYSGIDKSVVKQVRFHACKLKKRLPNWQIEDLEQELMLEVLSAMKFFNPNIGKLSTFVRCVLTKRTRNIIRDDINIKNGKNYIFVPLTDDISCPKCQVVDLEIKCFVDELISKLSTQDNELCEMLKHYSIVDIAKIYGVSVNTIYKQVRILKRHIKILLCRSKQIQSIEKENKNDLKNN